MTLKTMDGFETCRTDSDLRLRNYMYVTATPAALVPSATGMPGFAVSQISAAVSNTTSSQFNGATSTLGIWTGITTNAAWQAGGFSYGFSATANLYSVTGKYYGYAMGGLNTASMIFDGTNYWAFGYNGTTYNIFLSPDLKNWSPVPSLPAAVAANSSSGNQSTLTYLGSGVVAYTTSNQPTTIYYTSNSGASWNTSTMTSVPGVGLGTTTNATYPHVVSGGNYGTSRTLQVGTIGGTMTLVISVADTGGYSVTCRPRQLGNIFMAPINNIGNVIQLYTADVTQATALNTAAAWTNSNATMSAGAGSGVYDFTYIPTTNLYVFVGAGGVYTIPNTGAPGTPAILPSGAVTATNRYSTVGMNGIRWDGTQLIAWGTQGHVITSPDGITWTEQGTKILPVGTSGVNYSSAFYLNSTYVICSDSTSGLLMTTTDGVNNYQVLYANHKNPIAATAASPNGAGFIITSTTTQPANPVGASALAVLSGSTMFGFNLAPVTAAGSLVVYGQRNVSGTFTNVFTSTLPNVINTPLLATHYYEIAAVAVPGTTNMFNITMSIDGAVVYTQNNTQLVPTSDTSTLIVLTPLPSNQDVAQVDDLYFCLNDGTGVSGAQGAINIVAQRPSTDSQANWSKAGSAASNSLSTRNAAVSSQTANYVYSQNAGDLDTYTTADTLPAGYTPKAVLTEAAVNKLSATSPSVTVGIISGSTEVDGTAVSPGATTLLATQLQQTDPNGNVAWTAASVNAAKFALKHTV